MAGGKFNPGAALTTLGTGIAGLGGDQVSTTGSSDTQRDAETNSNYNNFSNQNLATWLSQLFSGLTDTSGSQTTSFNLDPATQALLAKLTTSYSNLATPFNAQAYQAGQIQNINAGSDLQRQAAAQIMASRGVSGPAAATTEANIDQNRINNIIGMQQQVPFLANQWNVGNLGQAANFFSAIPKGTTTTNQQQTAQNTSQNTQGNQVGSSVTGGTAYQSTNAADHQRSQQQQRSGPGNPLLAGLGLIGSVAGSFFSDETLKHDIEELPQKKAVDQLMRLRPVVWKWNKDGSTDTGLIAQEVQKTHPELVHMDPHGSGKLKVSYTGLIGELIAGLQAVNKKVEALA